MRAERVPAGDRGPALRVEGLVKRFGGLVALDRVSLAFPSGQISAVVGSNGAGKTTLFHILSGFLLPDSGRIYYRNQDITGLSPDRLVKKGIVRTFQDLRLCYQLTVLDNVLLGIQGQMGENLLTALVRPPAMTRQGKAHRDRALELLDFVGLAGVGGRQASQLSYGQQKLLSLARALATRADVLLLDEPSAGVAPQMVDQILKVVTRMVAQGTTVVMIEHDLDVVTATASTVWIMDTGRVVAQGTPAEMWNREDVIHTYLGI